MKVVQLANAEFLPHVCELVRAGHTVSIRAKGNSMRPFLESGRDVAFLSASTSYKVHDVVLAEIAQGHYVLHRIDRIVLPDGTRTKAATTDPDAAVTLRGDGNVRGTEQCRLKDIRAVARQFERNGKMWQTDTRFWWCYSRLWRICLPVRRYLLAAYRLLWRGELPQRFRRNKNKK
ncbi:MAG: S24/S26 family peptidase [Prevotellaceae bacterium]|nr:S24/S26 family peptidase [Prevotellaceae bacterium]